MFSEKVLKNVNGLNINYYFSKGYRDIKQKKTILFLHGFPELGFSFRYLIKILSANGYYCIAPDQRGYGKTNFISQEEKKVSKFSVLNLAKDIESFLTKMDINKVDLIGHDFGAYVSCYLALLYPKRVNSIITMSMPFSGPPKKVKSKNDIINLNKNLEKLSPKRKHYQKYFSSYGAAANILNCKQGLFDFFRGYFHFKSGNYRENKPYELKNNTAAEYSRLPEYYVMLKNQGMAQTIKNYMPTKDNLTECKKWLPDNDLRRYSNAFRKTGFKYPLYWYRVMLSLNEKKRILKKNLPDNLNIPSLFISGESDWGMFQKCGELKAMENNFFKNFYGIKIVKNAGHWVQQENPSETAKFILEFYKKLTS